MQAVILTKSAMEKNGVKGSCTTAIDLESGKMVRFVSDKAGSPIPYRLVNYQKLDVVDVRVLDACPLTPQTENLFVDPKSFRNLGGYRYDVTQLFQYNAKREFPDGKFIGEGCKKYDTVENFRHSIEIAYTTQFCLERSDHNRTKAHFRVQRKWHRYLSVTDFDYFDWGDTEWDWRELGDAWIVATIPTEPYLTQQQQNLGYFVFVAAIYPVHRRT